MPIHIHTYTKNYIFLLDFSIPQQKRMFSPLVKSETKSPCEKLDKSEIIQSKTSKRLFKEFENVENDEQDTFVTKNINGKEKSTRKKVSK